MPNYNYLPNNKSSFPHLENIDTYKFDNEFDYSRYDYTQMELQICTVPWDMGEAHIGNRTISGIGNVVYFESKANRDAWFDAIPDTDCYRFETKFKELHRDHVIDVPIPYNMCAKHNYLRVKYSLFANDDSPVMYEETDGLREWYWFIREVEFIAPNTTRLHLLDDAFQTWIYDVEVTGMILERGHAPMFAIGADEYLENPIANNAYLLTEDVNFGDATQVSHIDALALNAGTMYACIATTSNPTTAWTVSDKPITPAPHFKNNDGVPSVYVFAVPALSLNSFLTNVDANVPQFKQTIQGIFFASADLITLNGSFTFAKTTCYNVLAGRKTFELSDLQISQFGYSTNYQNIAKLYTWPYAHIEVTDELGEITVIKIEDTSGAINVNCALSLAFPFINIDAHLMGVGGNATASVTFRNIDAKTFNIQGQWYETLRRWAVPTFAVVLDAATEYSYSTLFDRRQMVIDYQAAKTIADRSANTAKDNADASADTGKQNVDASANTAQSNTNLEADTEKTNADNNADTLVANAALTTTANTSTAARSNTSAVTDSDNTQLYNNGVNTAHNILIGLSATSTITAAEQQGVISAAGAALGGVAGAVAAGTTGNVVGAVSSAVNGIIGAATTVASTAVTNGLTTANAQIVTAGNNADTSAANADTVNKVTNQTSTNSDLVIIQNTLTTGTTANSAATQKVNATNTQTNKKSMANFTNVTEKANATRTQTTEKANATRTQTAEKANATTEQERAISAIDNDVSQAALREPFTFGTFSSGDTAVTRPIALFSHIVTQSKAAIETAGDYMLRYGYALDRQWDFDGNWNIGKYFTYWKLRDFWVKNLNVPDMYMDRLRFFLFGGVTVWRRPEDIGNVTIYENYND